MQQYRNLPGHRSASFRFCRANLVGAVVILLLAGAARAADADGRPAPRLVCPEPEYAFGTLVNTQEVVHEFAIRNEGDGILKILQVKMPCGCMLLRLMDDRLDPGEQTILRARLPLKGLSGVQRKRIVLVSNDPAQPRTTLRLTGEALAELDLRPRRIFWGNLREDAADEATVEVRFREGEHYRVLGARSSSPLFVADAETADGKATGRIKVRTVPPLSRGGFEETLTVLTDHPRFGATMIPMSGRVIGEIYTVPDEIVLAPSNRPVDRTIMVYSAGKRKFSVLRADPPATNIEAAIRSSLFSGWRVELKNIIPDPALDGKRVVITTDYAPAPELAVPLRIREPEPAP